MNLHALQCPHQSRRHFVQFAGVIVRQLVQDMPSLPAEAQKSSALVVLVDGSFDEIFAFRAVDQFHGAVVFEPQAAGRVGDCDLSSFRSTRDLEE